MVRYYNFQDLLTQLIKIEPIVKIVAQNEISFDSINLMNLI